MCENCGCPEDLFQSSDKGFYQCPKCDSIYFKGYDGKFYLMHEVKK